MGMSEPLLGVQVECCGWECLCLPSHALGISHAFTPGALISKSAWRALLPPAAGLNPSQASQPSLLMPLALQKLLRAHHLQPLKLALRR